MRFITGKDSLSEQDVGRGMEGEAYIDLSSSAITVKVFILWVFIMSLGTEQHCKS